MTKTKDAPVAETPDYVAAIGQRPFAVQIIDPANLAFDTAAVLIAQGYRFQSDRPPEIFPHNGVASIWLTLGQPEQWAIDKAKAAIEHGMVLQQARYDRDVQAAATAKLEEYKREQAEKELEAKRKQLAAEIERAESEHAAAIAEIQRRIEK